MSAATAIAADLPTTNGSELAVIAVPEPSLDEMDLDALAVEANRATRAAEEAVEVVRQHMVRAGEALIRARARTKPKRKWGAWLKQNYEYSHQYANAMIRIAERQDEIENAVSFRDHVRAVARSRKPKPELPDEQVKRWKQWMIATGQMTEAEVEERLAEFEAEAVEERKGRRLIRDRNDRAGQQARFLFFLDTGRHMDESVAVVDPAVLESIREGDVAGLTVKEAEGPEGMPRVTWRT